MRELWRWNVALCGFVAGCFFVVDATFFCANLMKVLEGGCVPLLLAALVFGLMGIWHRGVARISERLRDSLTPLDTFLADVKAKGIPRVPGTAIFLTRAMKMAPPVMVWHVRNNRALHKHLVALTVTTESSPYVDPAERMTFERVTEDFTRVVARFGFMERPDVPALVHAVHGEGCPLDPSDLTYYVGHETVKHRGDGLGIPLWQELLFAFLLRNSAHVTDFFGLPSSGVVEIGRVVEI
jgi:KUP system potassium uptake protein